VKGRIARPRARLRPPSVAGHRDTAIGFDHDRSSFGSKMCGILRTGLGFPGRVQSPPERGFATGRLKGNETRDSLATWRVELPCTFFFWVAPGDCSPRAPADPDVRVSRIRFVK